MGGPRGPQRVHDIVVARHQGSCDAKRGRHRGKLRPSCKSSPIVSKCHDPYLLGGFCVHRSETMQHPAQAPAYDRGGHRTLKQPMPFGNGLAWFCFDRRQHRNTDCSRYLVSGAKPAIAVREDDGENQADE
jgi:hypothetical protein